MKKFFKYALFVLIAVLAPFVIANEVLRWAWLRNYPLMQITKWDTLLIHALKPEFNGNLKMGVVTADAWQGKNAYWSMQTNSQQIRGREQIGMKPPGVFRILCLGDSITMGLEVDDQYTYPSQLQALLSRKLNGRPQVEVINAGVWGYSSRQGLAYLDRRLLQYQPDLVILEFGINDSRRALLSRFPDKKIIRGDIDRGWKKLYYSPVGALILVLYEQPLVVFIKNLMLTMNVAAFMKGLSQLDKNAIQKHAGHEAEGKLNPRVTPRDFLENYMQFIILARQKKFPLMFYIAYDTPEIYRRQMLDLAREYKIPTVDFAGRFENPSIIELESDPELTRLLVYYREKLGDEFLKKNPRYLVSTDNGIHPNAVGNLLVARTMAEYIANLYFPQPPGQ
jgi:lysophospholipase L1-like esterase